MEPAGVMLKRVEIDGFISASMHSKIGLAVASQVDRSDPDGTGHRLLVETGRPLAGGVRPAGCFWEADLDGEQVNDGTHMKMRKQRRRD